MKLKRNPDNSVTLTGVGAVSGVYDYPDKFMSEFVSDHVLSNEASLKGAIGLDVTIEHDEKKVGIIEHATFENGKVLVDFIITDEDAISKIEDGTFRELSFRHKSESHAVSNQSYTHMQGVRDYSHLSIVEMARGGSECKILIKEE